MDIKESRTINTTPFAKLFLALFFFFSTGAFLELVGPEGVMFPNGIRVFWISFYLGVITLFVIDFRHVVISLKGAPFVVLLLFLSLASIAWSGDFSTTLVKSVALIITTVFALYIGQIIDIQSLENQLQKVLTILLVISIFFAMASPTYGRHLDGVHRGLVTGVFHHKNIFARITTLSAFIYFIFFLRHYAWQKRIINLILFIISILLIFWSESATGIVTILVIVPITFLVNKFKIVDFKIHISALITLVIGILTVRYIALNFEEVLEFLGKNATLSGRTILWVLLIVDIIKSPLVGYGYGSYWETTNSEKFESFIRNTEWVTHAHNGYIEIVLDLGLIGLIIFLAVILRNYRKILHSYGKLSDDRSFFLLFTIFYLTMNITQSLVLSQNNIFWFLFVYILSAVRKPNQTSISK